MKNINELLMDGVAVTNTTKTSDAADLRHCLGCVVDLVYTGSSLNGSAKLQASLDGSRFFDLPDTGATEEHDLNASGGSHQWYLNDIYFAYLRVSVTTGDANTATATARVFAKGV